MTPEEANGDATAHFSRVPMNTSDRALFVLACATVVVSLIYLAVIYRDLPSRVPTHFNLMGDADAVGDKAMVWFGPVLMSIIIVTLWIIAVINTNTGQGGHQLSERGHRATIGLMRRMLALLALCMAAFSWESILLVSGRMEGGAWLMLSLAAFIIISTGYTARMLRVAKTEQKDQSLESDGRARRP